MIDFTTKQEQLFFSLTLNEKEKKILFEFLKFLNDSGVGEYIPEVKDERFTKGGRPPHNYGELFAATLYGFAFSAYSSRELEDRCKFDLRYIFLTSSKTPSHSTFSKFFREVIVPNRKEIFACITKEVIKRCSIDTSDLFIDGTKFEANANKYKFVWKPTKFHIRLTLKVKNILIDLGYKDIPDDEIIPASYIAEKIIDVDKKLKSVEDKDEKKKINKAYKNLNKHLLTALGYEEKEEICGDDRNSFYKTDHGATGMCTKNDFYSGLGSNTRAAYNSQIGVSKGIICVYYVSSSRNDINDFIPTLKQYYEMHGKYPERVCADSGYGSYDNYLFLKENNIESYVKHQSFSGNVSGKNPDKYHYDGNETIKCLNGNTGVKIDIAERHPRNAKSHFYKVKGCSTCPFMPFCKKGMSDKESNERIFEINEEYALMKQETFDRLLTPEGVAMRVNRSCQVEGTFGVIKEDMKFTRLERTEKENVEAELIMIYLGYNIRKLFSLFNGKLKTDYWIPPKSLQPETPKKPSAKRLSKKAIKKSQKQPNEKAKKSYQNKYKRTK